MFRHIGNFLRRWFFIFCVVSYLLVFLNELFLATCLVGGVILFYLKN